MSETENTGARRRVLAMSVCAIGGIGAGAFGAAMLGSLRPSRLSLAASLESFRQIVDVSALKPGESKQVELVGRPVTLFRRTQEQLRDLERFESDIVDPTSRESLQPDFAKNRFRSMDPELLVVQPICTHLPCTVDYIPKGRVDMGNEWRGGFHCPCHSATFDLAGRVHKGMPTLVNLYIPPHKVISKNEVLLGHPEDTL